MFRSEFIFDSAKIKKKLKTTKQKCRNMLDFAYFETIIAYFESQRENVYYSILQIMNRLGREIIQN